MRRTLLLAMASLLALAGSARASDPVGIYGLVEKVVLEPEQGKPERAQVWGVFRLAKARRGDEYQKPAYGYLYYALPSGKEGDTRREWADLKEVAGTGQVIAFAGRYQEFGRVRKAAEKAEKADPYPVAGGMHKLNATSRMAKELRSLALPAEPSDGCDVPEGKVVLRAHGIADKDREEVRYVFEISDDAGNSEMSKPLKAGERADVASWTPKMAVKGDEEYTWRVWAVAGDWKGPALTATFRGKSAR
ncbi:MAG TPA: hypothetical protein VKA46_41450 [Gemmataceae bacterium]|nr:hypothetical protein [Gemmataceae bacterium]